MTNHEKKAGELFLKKCNCAQSVFCAFCDETGMDESTAMRISSSFGAGMGRLREVCGAVSGMFMAAGILYGYEDVEDGDLKAEHYARIQELGKRFEEENGTLICRELLKLQEKHSKPVPRERTAEYYRERPCLGFVESAGRILDEYIKEHPVEKKW